MNKLTIIERPYGSEDNECNTAERGLLQSYCNRHDEEINFFVVYKYCVEAYTLSGRKLIARQANAQFSVCKKFTEYLYLVEEVNGKEKRIKKSDW